MLSSVQKRIFLVLGILFLIVVSFIVFTDRKSTAKNSVTINILGDKKAVEISSNIEGFVGRYYSNKIETKLSKNIHDLKISSVGYADEYINVDAIKNTASTFDINLNSLNDTDKMIDTYLGVDIDNTNNVCTYFSKSTWAYCNVTYTDVNEKLVLKKDKEIWVLIAGGTFLSSESLDGVEAPTELLNFLGDGNE